MSFLLVIVATIFLISGLFLTKDLALIFISIGCSALAGLVLVAAVLRSRPKADADEALEGLGGSGTASQRSATTTTAAPAAAKSGAAFPIENYETLEVVEVLPLLGELDSPALEMVRQREASGRAHPWVLARIDALLESEAETGEWERDGLDVGGDEWAEPQPEWAESERAESEWSAADFPLEAGPDSDYGLEIARGFPIADYDSLRANDVLPLLAQLDSEDLKFVREVEAGGKARTSILSRIDALLARGTGLPGVSAPARGASARPSRASLNLPIADYDSLTVAQITAQLGGLSAADLRSLRNYEKRHKARSGVIQKIEAALLRAE